MEELDKVVVHANHPEIDLLDVLAGRVRDGLPIYVSGYLDEEKTKLHVEMINRLMTDTRMPVHVIHTLN